VLSWAAMGQKDEANDMQISLPEAMREFLEARVASGGYRSASEYLAELIRRDQDAARREGLENSLLAGLDSGPAEPFDEGFFERQRERIRRAGPGESQAS